jgi:hypothetical protein
MVLWRFQEKVTHLHGKLGVKGADDIIEPGSLGCDISASELRFDLRKPYLWVCGPEGWQFHANCCKGCGSSCGRIGSLLLGHVGSSIVVVTNVVREN